MHTKKRQSEIVHASLDEHPARVRLRHPAHEGVLFDVWIGEDGEVVRYAVGVIEGGTEIFLDGSILRFLARNSISPSQLPQRLGLTVLEIPGVPMMFQIGFVLVTFFEITSLLCVASKWFRRAWLAVMIPFHVLSWPLLQLLFLHNILLIVVLLVDLEGIAERIGLGRWLGARPQRQAA